MTDDNHKAELLIVFILNIISDCSYSSTVHVYNDQRLHSGSGTTGQTSPEQIISWSGWHILSLTTRGWPWASQAFYRSIQQIPQSRESKWVEDCHCNAHILRRTERSWITHELPPYCPNVMCGQSAWEVDQQSPRQIPAEEKPDPQASIGIPTWSLNCHATMFLATSVADGDW